MVSWCAFPSALEMRGVAPLFDEHRVGLKPILKKIWSKIGTRPEAVVQHRYEWLYVYGFVKPKTEETLWYLIPRVNTNWLNLVYRQFALDAKVNHQKKFS